MFRWKNLAISKKLYGALGFMTVLMTFGLLSVLFVMNTLSAVRSLVSGESQWSKAQKDAIQSLQKYVITGDEKFIQKFHEYIRVPLGDYQARIELEKPRPNWQLITEGFVQGKVHPKDVQGIVNILTRFSEFHYIKTAVGYWQQGDELVFKLIDLSRSVSKELQQNKISQSENLHLILEQITSLNSQFTKVEQGFTDILGEGSRWIESTLMFLLIVGVVSVGLLALYITFVFTQYLNHTLKVINEVAIKVGSGDYNQIVSVQSTDELGKLAQSLNRMAYNLRKQSLQRRQAEQASHTKNLFLANMSHEIRTPLNAILGFSELLRDNHLKPEEKNKYLDIIKRTGANLATIINDILDVTKIEAEQLAVEKSAFSLKGLLQELELILRKRCFEKNIELQIVPMGCVSDYICSDPSRLRQILLNVIGNAVKFTEFGHVKVEYQVVGSQLRFKVQDTGPGIPEQYQNCLFQPFEQGDSSVQKKYGGTGLGLLLSKKLAHLLGGDVLLFESAPGQGSTFLIEIDYEPVMTESMPEPTIQEDIQAAPHALVDKKVLVVEDTVDSQLLLKLYLMKSGASVEVASDGQEALDRFNRGEKFDLVLMDMQMPVMDGYTAVQRLREQGCSLPVIALTAYSMVGDREKTIRAGCTDYISKPVDKAELLRMVSRYVFKPRDTNLESL